MLKGLSGRVLRDRRILGFSRRWNTPHLPSEVLAACHGHNESVRNLAGLSEVDVNHADEKGMTALHWEAKKGCLTQVLMDAGADIEARNSLGRSPLLVACENGNLAKVKVLVEAGAGVRATDNEGATCCTLAGANGHTDVVRYLAGLPEVDVKQTDRLGNTAQEAAPEQGNAMKEEVKALQEMMKSVMDQQKTMLEAQKAASEQAKKMKVDASEYFILLSLLSVLIYLQVLNSGK